MKNFDLVTYQVEEMTQQEMLNIEGGNIFKKVANGIKTAAQAVGQALADAAEWTGEAAQDAWDFMNKHDVGATNGGGAKKTI